MRTQIEKIRKRTVVENVMEQIKELIASGRYQVGERLPTEQELADRFGIARSSVREALKTFNYLGVLGSRTGRGTYVCDRRTICAEALTWSILLGQEELFELVGLREALERSGLEALVQGQVERRPGGKAASARTLARLEQEIENMRSAMARQDVEGRVQADYRFHGTIIAGGGNRLFTAIYQTLRSFMYEEIRETAQGEDSERSLRDHEALLHAIQDGDGARAQELLHHHIRAIKAMLRRTAGSARPADQHNPKE